MNDKAKKKARQAELEYLLVRCYDEGLGYEKSVKSFSDWLEHQADCTYQVSFYYDEAVELIALYQGD